MKNGFPLWMKGYTGYPLKKYFAVAILLFLFSAVAIAQQVTGRVTSGDSAVSNATVQVKGKSTGTQTDASGSFSINAPAGTTLVISSIGFVTQEAKITSSAILNVQLRASVAQSMNEVVVVGYGTQKRADVTGSVASVPKARLSQLPVTNIMQAIEGAVAGVSITTNSSVPGRTATAQVRGLNSITAGTGPFIVVDGVPFNGSTNDINPNDIASMDILKDASAVAIYGTRGSNGVILITTKRGATGRPVVRYSGYAGPENIAHILKPLSPELYVQKYADYLKQNNLTQTSVLANQYEIANYNAGKTTDWIKEVTQTGLIQDHNISVSGGGKDVKYFISGEYLHQKGAVKGYQYHRASVRSNLDINVTDYLTVGTSLFYAGSNYDGGKANFYLAAAMSPYGSLYNTNGSYEIYPMYPELLYMNPLIGLYTDVLDRSQNLNGNVYAELKPQCINGLKFRVNAAYTYQPARSGSYTGRNAGNTIGGANITSSETKKWIVENILTYFKEWNKHHIDFTGLYSAQQNDYFTSNVNANTFVNDQLSFNQLGAGANVSPGTITVNNVNYSGSYRDKRTLLSQMARVNYSFNSRYLFTVTARRDGSSVFGANTTKYGLFPSVAFGWNIGNEGFISNIAAINSLKLRVSYGKTGNEAIPPYGTITTAGLVRFPVNAISTVGVLSSNLGNANLKWETTKGLNVGVDFSVLDNRISGTIDAYQTNTSDLLLKRNLPTVTGYASIFDNLGKTKNRGIEITLNTVNIKTSDFRWESTLNFSAYHNEIVGLYGNLDSSGNEISDIGNRWFIGQPIRVIYDYKLEGVWQEGEDASKVDPAAKPGSLKFADINKDGKIDANDRVILGSTLPKWTGGFTNTFHYKNLHLNIFLQTFQGALRNNVNMTYADEAGRMNIPGEIGYWTAANKSTTRPSISATAVTNTRGYGYPKDNSYTRIKDVTLSYTFPQSILDKIKLAGVTVYASGRNLYTFTNWIGWDPENDFTFRGSGDWVNNYPLVRSFSFGANVSLR